VEWIVIDRPDPENAKELTAMIGIGASPGSALICASHHNRRCRRPLSNGQDDSYFTQTIMGTARRPGHSISPLYESVRVAL